MIYEIGFFITIAMLAYSMTNAYFTKGKLEKEVIKLQKENSQIKKDYVMSTIGPDSFIAKTQKLRDNYEKIINEVTADIKTLILTEPQSTISDKAKVIEKYTLILEQKNKPVIHHLTNYF